MLAGCGGSSPLTFSTCTGNMATLPVTVIPDSTSAVSAVVDSAVTASARRLPGEPYYMTVVKAQQVQSMASYNEKMIVFPYRDLSAPTIASCIALGTAEGAGWQYIYDEMFWGAGLTIDIGLDEAAINTTAATVRAAGFLATVSILPGVIMDASFALVSPNSLDVIGIDIYPSGFLIENPSLQAYYNAQANPYISILEDAKNKLRQLGFLGEIWYIYQDGDDTWWVPQMTPTQKQLQYEAVKWAPYNGIPGLVSYVVTP